MIRINLLPVRAARKKEEVQRQLLLFTVFLVGVLFVGILLLQSNRSALASVEQSNRQLEAEIADLKKIIGEVDEYKKQQGLLEQKLGVIRKLKSDKTGPVHMLDELALRIPEKLWLETIEENGGKVTLRGVSINNEVIATFMNKMEDSAYFSDVFLVSIQARDEGDIKLKEFTVTSQLKVPTSTPEGT
jgi:type IV pilus assembly protein PilN